jgi:hypothetical protein
MAPVKEFGNSIMTLSTNLAHRRAPMANPYYEAVDQMEKMGVEDEYIQGWESGYLGMPQREEQRLTEAYEAGYADGKSRSTASFANWVKK